MSKMQTSPDRHEDDRERNTDMTDIWNMRDIDNRDDSGAPWETTGTRDAWLAAEQRCGWEIKPITQGGWNAGGVAASAGTHPHLHGKSY